MTPKKVSRKALKLLRGQRGPQGPPGPTAGGAADSTASTALSGNPPVVVSLAQAQSTQTPTTGPLTVRYPARLVASGAFDGTTNSTGGDVWCFLEYAPRGDVFRRMSAGVAELNGAPAAFAVTALGTADVGPGTYDVRARCAKTGTVASVTEAQVSVTATAR